MFARSSTLGLMITAALSVSADRTPAYRIQSSGAVSLNAAGTEARYGIAREKVDGKPVLTITLGATTGNGALMLFTDGGEIPRSGRYPVYLSSQNGSTEGEGRWFHACFVAGTVEQPAGVFHGESGWVTITDNKAGLISGDFELQAKGFLAVDMSDENQSVTLRGAFTAEGDSASRRSVSLSSLRLQ
jgi:hypothetical protein